MAIFVFSVWLQVLLAYCGAAAIVSLHLLITCILVISVECWSLMSAWITEGQQGVCLVSCERCTGTYWAVKADVLIAAVFRILSKSLPFSSVHFYFFIKTDAQTYPGDRRNRNLVIGKKNVLQAVHESCLQSVSFVTMRKVYILLQLCCGIQGHTISFAEWPSPQPYIGDRAASPRSKFLNKNCVAWYTIFCTLQYGC